MGAPAEPPSGSDLARAAEAFALALSSLPPDLPERISASQLRTLVAIRRRPGITVSELAQCISALPSSTTRLCDRLVAAGLIERAPAAGNRRFHCVHLTPSGDLLLDSVDRHRAGRVHAIARRMPTDLLTRLHDGLMAFSKASEAAEASEQDSDPDADDSPGPEARAAAPLIGAAATGAAAIGAPVVGAAHQAPRPHSATV